ncbi:MAG: phosphotransferase family protein [Acidimicrobiia bacterium]
MHGETDPPTTEELLLDALREATGLADLRYTSPPRPLSGGFWAEMYTIRLDGAPPALSGDLVARISPNAVTAARDATVQRTVFELGFPTAAIRLTLGPECAVGRAVTIMDLLPGRPLLGDLDNLPGPVALVRLARQLPAALAGLAARLHDLDVGPVHAAMTPFGTADITQSLSAGAERASALGHPDLALATDRLAALTADDPRVVCHGDLHVFNVIVDGDRPQLVDWTVARLAHPAYDVAFNRLLWHHPPMDLPKAVEPVVRAVGRLMSRRFASVYRSAARHGIPITTASLDLYEAAHGHRILLELAEWHASGTGPTSHPWHSLAPVVARSLHRVTGTAITVPGAR